MPNELLLLIAIGLAVAVVLIGRFMILDDPAAVFLRRSGRAMRDAIRPPLARVSLQELSRAPDAATGSDQAELGR